MDLKQIICAVYEHPLSKVVMQ